MEDAPLMSNYEHVFSPITIKGIEFKNRIQKGAAASGISNSRRPGDA
jgi:2,4-dienoyl-CoA reductase-like NADH-dependent reductase (Old Yellow Enzyme family)